VPIGERNVSTITLKYGNITKTLNFTINGIKPGADGSPAKLYRLLPSGNQIVRDKDGNTNPAFISCNSSVTENGVVTYPASNATIKYSIDGNDEETYSKVINTSNIKYSIKFSLYVEDKLMDSESIVVVNDGKDGLTAKPNLIRNSNFDVYDVKGNLAHWGNPKGDV
jgi:hypothetical protein